MQSQEFKHPTSLRIFFATEMWERYGFYVVQSLLALYLALHFKWADERVYALVGTFTALTYLSPLIGGWIADNFIGQKKSILVGAIILFFSYFLLFLISSGHSLTIALAGIAVGTGLLKPNISSLLGNEYSEQSTRREAGFTIFYMGLTTGIILGTTLPSQLNHYFGWSISFASAAIGMILALSVFVYGIHRYKIADYHPIELTLIKSLQATLSIIVLGSASYFILLIPSLADLVFMVVIVLAILYLLWVIRHENPKQAKQTIVIGILCLISVLFWAFYFQMFLSLTLFISRLVEPKFLGILFHPPYYVSIQSFGMIVFGYFLSRKKCGLNPTHSGIKTGNKFVLSIAFITLGYGIISLIGYFDQNATLISPIFIIPVYLLISIAELLLSPVGLCAITVLSSRKKVSTMMGIFFVSLGVGAFFSSKLAKLTAINPKGLSLLELKMHYTQKFTYLFLILLVGTLICFVLNLVIKFLLKDSTGTIEK